jgi:hypothetical protein
MCLVREPGLPLASAKWTRYFDARGSRRSRDPTALRSQMGRDLGNRHVNEIPVKFGHDR